MGKARVLARAVLAVLLCAGSSWGMELGQGFLGLAWGSEAAGLSGLRPAGSKGKVDFYVNPQVVHTIGGVPVAEEIYGFFEGRFFAVYINIDSIDVFGELKGYLNARYGDPDISMTMKSDETVYKWKHQGVRIKLKMQESTGRMKLGFYHLAEARSLSESEMESRREEGLRFLPIERGQRPQTMPLLTF